MAVKYKEIAEHLERDIRERKFSETEKLPTEEELLKQFGVSRTTVRKAIAQLVQRGFVYQVQGSGLFLRKESAADFVNLGSLRGLTQDLASKKIETKILALHLQEADEKIAAQMLCAAGTKLYFVKRLRVVENEPFSIEISFFKKEIVPYLNEEIASSSIYNYLIEDLELNIGFADKVIFCEKIERTNAELLQLQAADPALIIENTVCLANGTVFEVSYSIFHFQKAKLLNRINFK